MAGGILSDPTLGAIRVSLDNLTAYQKVISHNIANIDTPGYRAKTVASFDAQLRKALRSQSALTMTRTHEGHLVNTTSPDLTPRTTERDGVIPRVDGNTVSMEREMVELVETSLKYRALTQLASKRLMLFKTIVMES